MKTNDLTKPVTSADSERLKRVVRLMDQQNSNYFRAVAEQRKAEDRRLVEWHSGLENGTTPR